MNEPKKNMTMHENEGMNEKNKKTTFCNKRNERKKRF